MNQQHNSSSNLSRSIEIEEDSSKEEPQGSHRIANLFNRSLDQDDPPFAVQNTTANQNIRQRGDTPPPNHPSNLIQEEQKNRGRQSPREKQYTDDSRLYLQSAKDKRSESKNEAIGGAIRLISPSDPQQLPNDSNDANASFSPLCSRNLNNLRYQKSSEVNGGGRRFHGEIITPFFKPGQMYNQSNQDQSVFEGNISHTPFEKSSETGSKNNDYPRQLISAKSNEVMSISRPKIPRRRNQDENLIINLQATFPDNQHGLSPPQRAIADLQRIKSSFNNQKDQNSGRQQLQRRSISQNFPKKSSKDDKSSKISSLGSYKKQTQTKKFKKQKILAGSDKAESGIIRTPRSELNQNQQQFESLQRIEEDPKLISHDQISLESSSSVSFLDSSQDEQSGEKSPFNRSDTKSKANKSMLQSRIKENFDDFMKIYNLNEGGKIHSKQKCIILSGHPIKIIWDCLILLALVVVGCVVPIHLAFESTETQTWTIFYIIIDICFFVDIILTFFTSVSDDQGINEISNKKKIAIKYINSWFLIDVISIFPVDLLLVSEKENTSTNDLENVNSLVRVVKLGKLYRLIRLIRLAKVLKLLKTRTTVMAHFTDRMKINASLERLIFMSVFFLFFFHIMACLFIVLTEFDPDPESWLNSNYGYLDNLDLYTVSSYFVVQTISTVGYGDLSAGTRVEKIFCIALMFSGVVSFNFVSGSLASVIHNYDTTQAVLQERLLLLNKLRVQVTLSNDLHSEISKALHYDSRSNFEGLDKFIEKLPKYLQMQITTEIHKDHFHKFDLFRSIGNEHLLAWIGSRFKSRLIPSNTYFYQKGDVIDYVYFCLQGVSVFLMPESQNRLYGVVSPELYSMQKARHKRILQSFGMEDIIVNYTALLHDEMRESMDQNQEDNDKKFLFCNNGIKTKNRRFFTVQCIANSEVLTLEIEDIERIRRDFTRSCSKLFKFQMRQTHRMLQYMHSAVIGPNVEQVNMARTNKQVEYAQMLQKRSKKVSLSQQNLYNILQYLSNTQLIAKRTRRSLSFLSSIVSQSDEDGEQNGVPIKSQTDECILLPKSPQKKKSSIIDLEAVQQKELVQELEDQRITTSNLAAFIQQPENTKIVLNHNKADQERNDQLAKTMIIASNSSKKDKLDKADVTPESTSKHQHHLNLNKTDILPKKKRRMTVHHQLGMMFGLGKQLKGGQENGDAAVSEKQPQHDLENKNLKRHGTVFKKQIDVGGMQQDQHEDQKLLKVFAEEDSFDTDSNLSQSVKHLQSKQRKSVKDSCKSKSGGIDDDECENSSVAKEKDVSEKQKNADQKKSGSPTGLIDLEMNKQLSKRSATQSPFRKPIIDFQSRQKFKNRILQELSGQKDSKIKILRAMRSQKINERNLSHENKMKKFTRRYSSRAPPADNTNQQLQINEMQDSGKKESQRNGIFKRKMSVAQVNSPDASKLIEFVSKDKSYEKDYQKKKSFNSSIRGKNNLNVHFNMSNLLQNSAKSATPSKDYIQSSSESAPSAGESAHHRSSQRQKGSLNRAQTYQEQQKASSKIFRSSNKTSSRLKLSQKSNDSDSESVKHNQGSNSDKQIQFNLTSPQKKPPKLFLNDVIEMNRRKYISGEIQNKDSKTEEEEANEQEQVDDEHLSVDSLDFSNIDRCEGSKDLDDQSSQNSSPIKAQLDQEAQNPFGTKMNFGRSRGNGRQTEAIKSRNRNSALKIKDNDPFEDEKKIGSVMHKKPTMNRYKTFFESRQEPLLPKQLQNDQKETESEFVARIDEERPSGVQGLAWVLNEIKRAQQNGIIKSQQPLGRPKNKFMRHLQRGMAYKADQTQRLVELINALEKNKIMVLSRLMQPSSLKDSNEKEQNYNLHKQALVDLVKTQNQRLIEFQEQVGTQMTQMSGQILQVQSQVQSMTKKGKSPQVSKT